MADLSTIRTGLQTRLLTITGLRAYATWPDTITCPAALVRPVEWDYRMAIGNVNRGLFEIILLAAPTQEGLVRGQDKIDAYLDDTGVTSIKVALEAGKTLGGAATTLVVRGWRVYGSLEVAGIEYLGARIEVEVWS